MDPIEQHLRSFWPDREAHALTWDIGPVEELPRGFHIWRIAPKEPGESWVYVTSGASTISIGQDYAVEFLLVSPIDDLLNLETLAVVTSYQAATSTKVDLNATLNLGRPWLPGSQCSHLLVSLPYIHGPKLEWLEQKGKRPIRFLWLLPITESEKTFAVENGIEAIESRFEDAAIIPDDPCRGSVV